MMRKISTVRVKCAQEHNVVHQPGLKPGPFDPESRALTIRPLRLPLFCEVTLTLNVVELICSLLLGWVNGSSQVNAYSPDRLVMLPEGM